MTAKFLKPNDPVLTKVAKEIPQNKISSATTQKIIKTMLEVAFGEQKDSKKPVMVGLAAPQIGILKRIILVDIKADGKGKAGNLRIYINPQITWVSKREEEWYEGCYSTGRICGIVSRPIFIKIQALKLHSRSVYSNPLLEWEFEKVEEKWTGYIARIFQHEIDHLNGKVFTSRIKEPDKLHWVEEHEFPLYRNQEAWRNWPNKASWDNC